LERWSTFHLPLPKRTTTFLVVNEAATFTTLTSGGTDLVTLYNLAAAPIAAGMVIRGAKGQNITAVAVSGGSVIGYTNI
jgi:hypothetical protein